MPFTEGRNFQDLVVQLTTSVPARGQAAVRRSRGAVLGYHCRGRDSRCRLANAWERVDVRLAEEPDRWHRYALQLRSDGSVDYLVDGGFAWRSGPDFVSAEADSVHLKLAGNTLAAEVAVGDVWIFGDLLYVLAD